MSITDCISHILSNLEKEKQKPLANNPLAIFIRQEFKISVQDNIKNKSLIIKSSAGSGVWADVPWLSILDDRITTTTQDGLYPVFLFRADSKGVYLSLNQGTTKPRARLGKLEAEKLAKEIAKNILSDFSDLKDWTNGEIELNASTNLGKSYEDPNIAARYYSKNALPTNEKIIEDLTYLLSIYDKIAENWSKYKNGGTNESTTKIVTPAIPTKKLKDGAIMNSSIPERFIDALSQSNIKLSQKLVYRFIAATISKPFIILTGLSGSGKTKLAEAFSLWLSDNANKQICMVAVGADWTNREPLLGFPNALEQGKYVKPDNGVLDLIMRAESDQEHPYFLILDEMNMSHVERYFADFLSAMESTNREISLHPDADIWKDSDGNLNDGVPAKIKLSKNLFIIGTVNIDETTYMFSPKVLDRAHVIEFRVSQEEMKDFLENTSEIDMNPLRGQGASMASDFVKKAQEKQTITDSLNKELIPFFEKLKNIGAEFGYRTAVEFSQFVKICQELTGGKMTRDEIIDAAIMQKLLPKVHGSRNKVEKILRSTAQLCLFDTNKEPFTQISSVDIKYPLSYEKIERMQHRVITDGFTSYAEA